MRSEGLPRRDAAVMLMFVSVAIMARVLELWWEKVGGGFGVRAELSESNPTRRAPVATRREASEVESGLKRNCPCSRQASSRSDNQVWMSSLPRGR